MNKREYILQINNISKTFPGVKALKSVSLDLMAGEVLALCGENGAGKSTLMKILAAIFKPDSDEAEIIYQGQKVQYNHPLDAKKAGIILIFQELSLVKQLSVAENIFLGSLPKKNGLIDWKKLFEDTNKVLKEIECTVNPKTTVGDLSIAQQQMVEIARTVALGARVLILDEPTSSLTEREKITLFKNIQYLKNQNVGIIYISHKLNEVFEISDRITVLRDGCKTGTLITKNANLNDIVKLMIGRTLDDYYFKSKTEIRDEVLRVENLSINKLFENISFSVRRGEVVGLYGLVGAGRTELAETLFGIRIPDKGQIYIEGKSVKIKNSYDAIKQGIGLVPENRAEQGLILRMSCKDNLCLAKLPWLKKYGFLSNSKLIQTFSKYKDMLSIATPSADQEVLKLSGGNQQKIVIGKWLSLNPKILIMDEPTRGIDVGAKAEIYKLIAELSEKGIAIIIISSEMPEIMGICNRIITISLGKKTGEFLESEISEKNLIEAITIQN